MYILDGDTIYYGKDGTQKLVIRVAGIDTPETRHYRAGKFKDQEYGPEAAKTARTVIRGAKKVEYLPVGADAYGRTLAHIFIDGGLFEVEMLRRGLAYETVTSHGDNGYPELAAAILEAARIYPRLPFENPHAWRAREWSEEKERAELQKDLGLKRTAMDKSLVVFDDGDTISYKNITFRILGMDTPEIIHENDGIFEDQPYGRAAAAYTKKLILEAKTMEYLADGYDTYGRTLAHIFINGKLLSVTVIKAGLAYESVSKFGDSGFPGYSRLILAAAKSVPVPPFENPLYWRAKHQHRSGSDWTSVLPEDGFAENFFPGIQPY